MPSLVRLHAHPQTDSAPEVNVEVAIARTAGQVSLRYEIRGNVAALLVPVSAGSGRRDALWRHTCAELFIAVPGDSGYCEFNFSPSGEWAAYEFDAYRHGMRAAVCMPPVIEVEQSPAELSLSVRCGAPQLGAFTHLQLGLSMVIEDIAGRCSYWALTHPASKPDFHRREAWLLQL